MRSCINRKIEIQLIMPHRNVGHFFGYKAGSSTPPQKKAPTVFYSSGLLFTSTLQKSVCYLSFFYLEVASITGTPKNKKRA
jgi:hypothetical protein